MARLITLFFPAQDSKFLLEGGNGAATSSIILANPYPIVFPNLARTITLSSTDNLDFNFPIYGTDQFGNDISEILVGPNNSTVTSVHQYNTITAIGSELDYSNLDIGIGSTGTFQWIKLNTLNIAPNTTISVEVFGTIDYTVNQTIDSLGGYEPIGPFFKYVQPGPPIFIGDNNPITTTNGSSLIKVIGLSPFTQGLKTDDIVTIGGAETTGGLTPQELNISAPITVVSPSEFDYYAPADAASDDVGGGSNVTYTFPAIPVSFPVTANLTNATTNQIYALSSPVTALQGIVNSSSAGGSLKINFLQQGII